MSSGTAIATIQAPSVNFAWITSNVTSPVVIAPRPFTATRRRQRGSLRRRQYWTIPACDSVNAVKTPIT